jgi:hypothetical protein
VVLRFALRSDMLASPFNSEMPSSHARSEHNELKALKLTKADSAHSAATAECGPSLHSAPQQPAHAIDVSATASAVRPLRSADVAARAGRQPDLIDNACMPLAEKPKPLRTLAKQPNTASGYGRFYDKHTRLQYEASAALPAGVADDQVEVLPPSMQYSLTHFQQQLESVICSMGECHALHCVWAVLRGQTHNTTHAMQLCVEF